MHGIETPGHTQQGHWAVAHPQGTGQSILCVPDRTPSTLSFSWRCEALGRAWEEVTRYTLLGLQCPMGEDPPARLRETRLGHTSPLVTRS